MARKGLGTSDEWIGLRIHGARVLLIPRCVFQDSPIPQYTPSFLGT
jgi:hypothetical protein